MNFNEIFRKEIFWESPFLEKAQGVGDEGVKLTSSTFLGLML